MTGYINTLQTLDELAMNQVQSSIANIVKVCIPGLVDDDPSMRYSSQFDLVQTGFVMVSTISDE